MNSKSNMTISEFSKITGIKRANLIFYDNIGLLAPEFRGENEYRYYTRRQLGTAYLITALRELGLGLDEIRRYASERTPGNLLTLLSEQEEWLEEEINRLRRMKDMMKLHREMTKEGISCRLEEVLIREQEREPVFLGSLADDAHDDDENSILFYQEALAKGMAAGYPLGSIVSSRIFDICEATAAGRPESGDNLNFVKRYYFKVKNGHNAYKPKGLYAVTCGNCGYGQSDFLYARLLRYLKENDYVICGDAYEEYPLNEMAIQDDRQYLAKVEIMVKKKGIF